MTILFDNYSHNSACRSLWGFSAYLEEHQLLFDTGSNGRVLLSNMKQLGIDAKDIKYMFISHADWDHIGGIDSILELNSNITIFVPSSLSRNLIHDLKSLTKSVVIIDKTSKNLFGDIYTTGVIGKETPEQSLIINDTYPKVITGCGHYGIENIVKISKEIIHKDVKYALGGFHLLDTDDKSVLSTIKVLKGLGLEKVMPTHCTGDRAIVLFREYFKELCVDAGVGCCVAY